MTNGTKKTIERGSGDLSEAMTEIQGVLRKHGAVLFAADCCGGIWLAKDDENEQAPRVSFMFIGGHEAKESERK